MKITLTPTEIIGAFILWHIEDSNGNKIPDEEWNKLSLEEKATKNGYAFIDFLSKAAK